MEHHTWRQVVLDNADPRDLPPSIPIENTPKTNERTFDKFCRLNEPLVPVREQIGYGLKLLSQSGKFDVHKDYPALPSTVAPSRITFTETDYRILDELNARFTKTTGTKPKLLHIVKAALHHVRRSPLSPHYAAPVPVAEEQFFDAVEIDDQIDVAFDNTSLPWLVSSTPDLYEFEETVYRPSKARDIMLNASETDLDTHRVLVADQLDKAREAEDSELADLLENTLQVIADVRDF